jgi:pyridine nucleotide-disulfide oxidoreductase family protein
MRDLVLVGGGHAHVLVLRDLKGRLPADVELTVVADLPHTWYSGMAPGCVAGLYRPDEIRVNVAGLCRWAGARFIEQPVVGMDPGRKRLQLENGEELAFDRVSLDVGSTTRGLDTPGVRDLAVPTRPLGRLLQQIDGFVEDHPDWRRPLRVVVVGAGAAGTELAFALRARLSGLADEVSVTVVSGSPTLRRERGSRLQRVVARELVHRSITLVSGQQAVAVTPGELRLDPGDPLPHDLLIWATGGAAHPMTSRLGLATTGDGFIRTTETLQSVSHPDVFAAGDCIQFEPRPLPKAGVYAVRQGPVLAHNLLASLTDRPLRPYKHNLLASLTDRPLRPYKPQRGFLALLMTGDGRAIASWKGLAAAGRWVWRWKDRIDRLFMASLDPERLG